MSMHELSIAFSYISVGMVKKNFISSWKEFTGAEEKYYTFEIKKAGTCNIRICQLFKRFAPGLNPQWKQYNYSPFIFEIFDIKNKAFLDQGANNTHFGAKSVNCNARGFLDLQPGSYMIKLKMNWAVHPHPTANICSYFEHSIEFSEIAKNKGQGLWIECMSNLMKN